MSATKSCNLVGRTADRGDASDSLLTCTNSRHNRSQSCWLTYEYLKCTPYLIFIFESGIRELPVPQNGSNSYYCSCRQRSSNMSNSYCKLTPSRTVVASFTPRQKPSAPAIADSSSVYEIGDWVLCLASAPKTVSCALSNGNVQVYDQTTLFPILSYVPVKSGALVTDIIYGAEQEESCILWTSGNDGSVVVQDLRQRGTTPAQSVNIASLQNISHESALSLALGLDGNVLAVSSSKARIHFLDVRKMSSTDHSQLLLGSYVNSHSDAITQVRFHPHDSSILLSAGEDGLACVYNTTRPSEEQALESVMNIGAPCRRVGFCDGGNSIYCLTGSETASVWDWNAATCLNNFGDFGFRNTFEAISTIPIDYLVNIMWDPIEQELILCAGNHSGNMAVFHCGSRHNGLWQTRELLMGGHHGVVRDWCPKQSRGGGCSTMLFTAGEDARLCEWNRSTATSLTHLAPNDICMAPSHENKPEKYPLFGRSGPIRRQRQDVSAAAKPY
jgi:hypothetical protein